MKTKNRLFPARDEINSAIHSFSYKQMILFVVLTATLIVSVFLIIKKLNDNYLIERPIPGGSFTEGVIGSPRFINPVIASSNTDRDISQLVFSGLMKKQANGEIVPDIAESYEISSDMLTYTFKIKEGLTFHDKETLDADDVVFTIQKIQDGQLKSPVQANWNGVTVNKEDDMTITFRLRETYASFLENTTVGIIPSHIWANIDTDDFTFSDMNIQAIGSGPYEISNVSKKKNGLIESIKLKSFDNYSLGEVNISKITFKFFRNEDEMIRAYNKGTVDQINAISPMQARILESSGKKVSTANLSRVFGLFFNSNKQDIFRNKNVVNAIDLLINKQQIIDEVLHGYGEIIDGPIPKEIYNDLEEDEIYSFADNLTKAEEILSKDNWQKGEDGIRSKDGKRLSFSISTGDAPELQQAVNIIKDNLKQAGIEVDIKVFEIANLNQSVIRPREYEALFFGQIISNETDLFAFWHSSQRNDPGLNVAIYTNSKVDGLLEKIISDPDQENKKEYFENLNKEIKADAPAVFIYSPDFIYLTDKNIKNIRLGHITLPSERFLSISDWYKRTEKVWNFLNK